jgi:peptide/nickel transport system substrate-binding protein
MADLGKQQSAVETGRADLMDISGLPGQLYGPLAIRFPTRIHSAVDLDVRYLFLNTRQPPFTSLKARQAVNYAIDRARIIQLLQLGSPGQATSTCQVLPPGYLGHEPYCPYTIGPQDGAWHAPDLVTAVRLARVRNHAGAGDRMEHHGQTGRRLPRPGAQATGIPGQRA